LSYHVGVECGNERVAGSFQTISRVKPIPTLTAARLPGDRGPAPKFHLLKCPSNGVYFMALGPQSAHDRKFIGSRLSEGCDCHGNEFLTGEHDHGASLRAELGG
jgi:hypothetical protein